MKKVIIFLMLILFVSPVFSEKVDSGETLRLSLTITNVVYVGVTDKAVKSSIVPSTNYTDIGFYFNPSTGMWETEDAYIYVISFVSSPIKVKLQNTTLTKKAGNTKEGPASLTYTGYANAVDSDETFETSNDITFGTSETSAQYIYEEKTPSYVTTDENGNTSTVQKFLEARIKSWQFKVVVNPSSYGSTTVINSGAEYQATFTLTIEGV